MAFVAMHRLPPSSYLNMGPIVVCNATTTDGFTFKTSTTFLRCVEMGTLKDAVKNGFISSHSARVLIATKEFQERRARIAAIQRNQRNQRIQKENAEIQHKRERDAAEALLSLATL